MESNREFWWRTIGCLGFVLVLLAFLYAMALIGMHLGALLHA